MGRQLRMVPPNYTHPENARIYDKRWDDAVKEWKEGFAAWESGEYDSPPDREYYHMWNDCDRTWYQVWETVSEGSPVTPPFPTKEELENYLLAHGDFWDQERKGEGWSKEGVNSLFDNGFAPSLVVIITKEGQKFYEPKDGRPS